MQLFTRMVIVLRVAVNLEIVGQSGNGALGRKGSPQFLDSSIKI